MSPAYQKLSELQRFFVGQDTTKYPFLQAFKCQYLIEILKYRSLHVIKTCIGFKMTFNNIRSQGAPLLISREWCLMPPGFCSDLRPWV